MARSKQAGVRREQADGVIREWPIESIDLEANGISRVDGKVCFVRGALPGERVLAQIVRSKASYDVAQTLEVLQESSQRVTPACPHYGVCGGCTMQHLTPQAQLAIKQRALEDQLWHLGRVKAETLLRPIAGPAWGYRFRARLSVRYVVKKGRVLVGFHEKHSSYVAEMQDCKVLEPKVARLIMPLRLLMEGLSIRNCMPQIEVAVGQTPAQPSMASETVVALVFRILEAPSAQDEEALQAFAREHDVEIWYQPKGPETIYLFCDREGRADVTGQTSRLGYALPEFGVYMPFRPTDFTQVNHGINTVMVGRSVRLLDPQPSDRVADLFCGLGNFTLPLATRAAQVVGIEGSPILSERARQAAAHNGLADMTRFVTQNLFELSTAQWQALGPFDRVLIDPPREGALALAKVLAEDPVKPRRLVYVSCNPATLARDAGILCHEGGWVLRSTGAVNMFPHTSHVESISVFEPAPV